MKRLDGKRILVAGAAGSIGRATAVRLAQEGAVLAIADRQIDLLKEVAVEVGRTGAAVHTLAYDAASARSSAALVDDAVAALGGLDAVCVVAGVLKKSHFADIATEEWNSILQINLSSAFTISQCALPHLIATSGNIVYTASTAGLAGQAYYTAYAVSKAGLIALAKSLAAELASAGVRVNVVCPGGVRTAMAAIPPVKDMDPDLIVRRSKLRGLDEGLGQPEDIAAAFAYLVSGDARYVSGTCLVVDGAQTLV